MLAAYSHLHGVFDTPSLGDGHSHQFAHTNSIQRLEGIYSQYLLVEVLGQEIRDVIGFAEEQGRH